MAASWALKILIQLMLYTQVMFRLKMVFQGYSYLWIASIVAQCHIFFQPFFFRIPLLLVSPVLVHARSSDGGWKRCYTVVSMICPLLAALLRHVGRRTHARLYVQIIYGYARRRRWALAAEGLRLSRICLLAVPSACRMYLHRERLS